MFITLNYSKMVPDRFILTTADWWEVALWSITFCHFTDLEWPL